ncbi:hypothetical protein Aiant_73370 [Actinoplanes ianthinogenes]|uniref:Uncharacterized protein n=1 Tax=Actinoplanes ianthinogenes TaxID=122358 RepID=A0ABN6CNA0_9ACTN|nr:hypothetical protein Aiant_73370 [Actinoplanes ianthinogenes]
MTASPTDPAGASGPIRVWDRALSASSTVPGLGLVVGFGTITRGAAVSGWSWWPYPGPGWGGERQLDSSRLGLVVGFGTVTRGAAVSGWSWWPYPGPGWGGERQLDSSRLGLVVGFGTVTRGAAVSGWSWWPYPGPG